MDDSRRGDVKEGDAMVQLKLPSQRTKAPRAFCVAIAPTVRKLAALTASE